MTQALCRTVPVLRKQKKGLEKLPVEKRVSQPKVSTPCSGQPAVWMSASPRGSPRCGRPCPTGQPVVWTSVSSWAARGVEVRAHPGQLWCGRLSTCLGLQEACLCRSLLSGGGLHPHCLELTHSGQHEAGWNRVRAPSYVRSEPPRCPALTHSSVPVAQVPPSPSTS